MDLQSQEIVSPTAERTTTYYTEAPVQSPRPRCSIGLRSHPHTPRSVGPIDGTTVIRHAETGSGRGPMASQPRVWRRAEREREKGTREEVEESGVFSLETRARGWWIHGNAPSRLTHLLSQPVPASLVLLIVNSLSNSTRRLLVHVVTYKGQ